MNKSIEFIRNRIANGYAGNMEHLLADDVTMSYYENPIKWLYEFGKLKSEKVSITQDSLQINTNMIIDSKTYEVLIEIVYNENEAFEYFTKESCVCDGTFFYSELSMKILEKIIQLRTWNQDKMIDTKCVDEHKKLHFKYTIGDFVYTSEIDKNLGTKDKPWLTNRQTVMLPIKCDLFMLDKKGE